MDVGAKKSCAKRDKIEKIKIKQWRWKGRRKEREKKML